MASEETVRALSADKWRFFEFWRETIRTSLPETERHILDTTPGKLLAVQLVLDSGQATADHRELLQGLGIIFGDALAAELDMIWAHVTDITGSGPALIRTDVLLSLNAFGAIEKRVLLGETPIDVCALFDALCFEPKRLLYSKPSLWRRILGPNLTRRTTDLSDLKTHRE